jgi:adenosyl cobinamide kinase/adenosyl cobinamide phosphate guanylyltransferase
MLIFLLGGARSGKSRLAVELGGPRAAFVATGTPSDDEMAERIARHRDARPAGWRTIEEPRDLARALAALEPGETAIVDCLSLWVSNLLEDTAEEEIVSLAERDAAAFAARDGLTVVVSNEVGMSIVPMHPVGRAYRDALGRVNAVWAAAADESYLVVAGKRLSLA